MPHRAHVHGRRPPAEDARDDHGAHRARAARRAGRAAAAAAAGLRGPVRGDAGPADHDPAARPAAARVPARPCPARPARPEGPRRGRAELAALEQELELVLRLGEVNPMLGTRGCRLGIVHPEIYEMQVEAIMLAARAAATPPHLEIMIPLVDFEAELARAAAMVVRVGERHGLREGEDYIVGTMIELPRACFIADRLAPRPRSSPSAPTTSRRPRSASRATTSRPASSPAYLERRILDRSPFESVDVDGVGALVEIAVALGPRAARGDRARRLRRARRRPGLDRVLPPRGPRLRVVLAVPAADRPRGGRAGRARMSADARSGRRRLASLDGFDRVLPPPAAQARARAERLGPVELAGRRIWNVNSTARGGGVAEMLGPLLAYARGAGIDARWAVIDGTRRSSPSPSASTTACTACRATAGRSAPPSARSTRRRSRPTPTSCARC